MPPIAKNAGSTNKDGRKSNLL